MVRTCMCISAKHQQTLMIRDRVSLSRVSDHTHTEYFLSSRYLRFLRLYFKLLEDGANKVNPTPGVWADGRYPKEKNREPRGGKQGTDSHTEPERIP